MTPKIILEMTIMLLEFGIKENDPGIVKNNLAALGVYSVATPGNYNQVARYIKAELPPKMAQANFDPAVQTMIVNVGIAMEAMAEKKGWLAEEVFGDLRKVSQSSPDRFDKMLEVLQGAVDNHPLFAEVQS